MNKIKDITESTFSVILTIIFIYGEIFGIYHSFKDHTTFDGVIAISVPPYAWYRSVEMLWHDDFAGVDWDKKLNGDLITCVYFFTTSAEPKTNQFELNSDLEKFFKQINKYPEDKRAYLKESAKNYVFYYKSFQKDYNTALRRYFIGEPFDFHASLETLNYEEKLKEFGLDENLQFTRHVKEMFNNSISELPKTPNALLEKEIMSAIEISLVNQYAEINRIFKYIFNEDVFPKN